jgi:hypothetical protein
MANAEHLAILRQGVDVWNACGYIFIHRMLIGVLRRVG